MRRAVRRIVSQGQRVIEFKDVGKSWPGGVPALAGVSFRIAAGEFVVLAGHSGAGKTTLFRLLAGLERPTHGQVLVHGQDVGRMRPAALPWLRRKLGLIFQDTQLLTDRDALANVMLPLLVTGQARAAAESRARTALERVGLAGREHSNPRALSGGDQQRLAIARAIVNKPAILVADEPTANLDRAAAHQVIDIFRQFNTAGVTVLIASHDESLFADHAQRVLRLDHGRLVDAGTPVIASGTSAAPLPTAEPA